MSANQQTAPRHYNSILVTIGVWVIEGTLKAHLCALGYENKCTHFKRSNRHCPHTSFTWTWI